MIKVPKSKWCINWHSFILVDDIFIWISPFKYWNHLWLKIPHEEILILSYDPVIILRSIQKRIGLTASTVGWYYCILGNMHLKTSIYCILPMEFIFSRLWKRKKSPFNVCQKLTGLSTECTHYLQKKQAKRIIPITGHGPDNVKSLNCQFCVLFMGNLPSNLLQSISPTIQRKYWWEITASSPIYYVYIIHLTKS